MRITYRLSLISLKKNSTLKLNIWDLNKYENSKLNGWCYVRTHN